MSRWIDIDDISLLKTVSVGGLSAKALWKRIRQQPSIDLVRCGECKYQQHCGKAVEHTTYEPTSITIECKPIGFCSYGERKESE